VAGTDTGAQDYYWSSEALEDWTRQAGLIDFAWGIHGLRTMPQARRSLVAVCESLCKSYEVWGKAEPKTVHELLTEQAVRSQGRPWPVRSVLDGAARAGLLVNGIGVQARGDTRHLGLWAPGWRETSPAAFMLELTAEGLCRALAKLVNP